LVVSDASGLATFAEHRADVLAIAEGGDPRGTWGLGFHSNGDMLVKKGPIATVGDIGKLLQHVRARHLLLAADLERVPRRTLEDAQPLRHRDWLFAASGTAAVREQDFVREVQQSLPGTVFATKRSATPEEAIMMILMDAMYRAGSQDARKLSGAAIRGALAAGVTRLREIAGARSSGLAFMLHDRDRIFAVSLGRALHMARGQGVGGGRRSGRGSHHAHLRSLVVADWLPRGESAATPPVTAGSAAEAARAMLGPVEPGLVWEPLAAPGAELGKDTELSSFDV
jgi:hypothetical protein